MCIKLHLINTTESAWILNFVKRYFSFVILKAPSTTYDTGQEGTGGEIPTMKEQKGRY